MTGTAKRPHSRNFGREKVMREKAIAERRLRKANDAAGGSAARLEAMYGAGAPSFQEIVHGRTASRHPEDDYFASMEAETPLDDRPGFRGERHD